MLIGMVEAHLAASGDRQFLYIETMGGSSLGLGAEPGWSVEGPDKGALDDLCTYGFLGRTSMRVGGKYRVTGEGIHFCKWLLEQEGTPIDQVEEDALRLVDGPGFARRHEGAATHIVEAFSLLRSADVVTEQVTSEIGGHLRSAVFDFASRYTDGEGRTENPAPTLKAKVQQADVEDRERKVLLDLVRLLEAVLSLDQRLTHVRDELDRGQSAPGWEEIRRAVFTTVFVCAELDRAFHE